jgi:PPOX class probable F420-dependent enzyme
MPHDQSLRREFLADGILDLRAASRASLSGAMNFTSISSPNGFGQTRHMSPEEIVERLRRARVGRLATVRPDGTPHVVPFVFAVVGEGNELVVYWAVDAKPKRRRRVQRIENIEAHPQVEFVVDGYDEAWADLWWVRVTGRARVVTNAAEQAEALTALTERYPPYRGTPPDGPVVAIDVDHVSGWSVGELAR